MTKINETFFSSTSVNSFIQFMINNPNKVYLEEMYVHLKLLFQVAMESITEIDYQSGLLSNVENTQSSPRSSSDLANVWQGMNEHPDWNAFYPDVTGVLYDTLKSLDNDLLLKLQHSPKLQSVYVEFPQLYLDAVVQLTYPNAYVACFMDNCMNPSIWGTYGNSHTGVCLKFNTGSESNPTLSLKGKVGYGGGGYIYEFRTFPLQLMTYSSNFQEVDFFRNLGGLSFPQLREQWYTDENERVSVCSEDIFQNKQGWREHYWNEFSGAYLTKLPAWAHEREYRLLLQSFLGLFEDPKDRVLEYKFEDLEAIIFGMKTPKEDRAKIIEIVKRKCEESGRSKFDFFEMAYPDRKNEWYLRQLGPFW